MDSYRAPRPRACLLSRGGLVALIVVVLGLAAGKPMIARGDQSSCGDFASLLSTSIHMTNADAGLLQATSSGLTGRARTDELRSAAAHAIGVYKGLRNTATKGGDSPGTNPTILAAWKSLAVGLTLRINAYSILLRALSGAAMTSGQKAAYSQATAQITANNRRWTPIAAALNKLYHGC
jgi:hypothetical protein